MTRTYTEKYFIAGYQQNLDYMTPHGKLRVDWNENCIELITVWFGGEGKNGTKPNPLEKNFNMREGIHALCF